MVVYFHLHWWWWAVVDCPVLYWAVLGCTGLYWAVLGCTGLYWSVLNWAVVGSSRLLCDVLGCTGRIQQLFVCVFSHFRHGDNNQTTNQPGDPSASLLLTSMRRQSFAKNTPIFLWRLFEIQDKLDQNIQTRQNNFKRQNLHN